MVRRRPAPPTRLGGRDRRLGRRPGRAGVRPAATRSSTSGSPTTTCSGRRGESVTEGAAELLADAHAARRRPLVRRLVGDGLRRDRQQPDPAHRGGRAAARPDVRLRPPAGRGRGAGRGVATGAPRPVAPRCCARRSPLAADGTSSLARALDRRARSPFRRGRPGAQFVHHDDVASAVVLAVERRLDGIYNVAPDGSIPGDRVRALSGRRFRLPLPDRDRRRARFAAVAVPARPDPARPALRTRGSRGWSPTTSCAPRGGDRRSRTSRRTSRAPKASGRRW